MNLIPTPKICTYSFLLQTTLSLLSYWYVNCMTGMKQNWIDKRPNICMDP